MTHQPVRVLQVIGAMNRAGAESFVMNLYRKLDRTRFQFDFVRFGPDPGLFEPEIEAMGGRIIVIEGRNLISRSLRLWQFLRAQPYAVVHAHTGFSGAWFLAAARLAGSRHRLLHSHSAVLRADWLRGPYSWLSRRLGDWAQTMRLSCGRQATLELHGSAAPVTLFPNCVDLAAFAPDAAARRAIRAEFNIAEDQQLVVHVARFEPVKNHDFTLALADRLRDDDKVRFLTVGTGSLEDWFREQIDGRGLGHRLAHAGLRTDIAAIFGAADAMILPSQYEGFPVVAVEAQAAGLPALFAMPIDTDVDLGLGLAWFGQTDDLESWVAALAAVRGARRGDHAPRSAHLASLRYDSTAAAADYQRILEQCDAR